jgi:hypothetical protein
MWHNQTTRSAHHNARSAQTPSHRRVQDMTDDPRHLPTLPALATQRTSRRERARARLSHATHLATGQALVAAQQAKHLLTPRVEAALDWLTAPEQAEQLQSAAASLAGLGMRIGFKADPRAHLLFELADWLEARHGRLPVLQCLLAHNPMLDGSLIELIRLRFDPRTTLDRAPYDLATQRVRDHLLAMLAELVALETEEAPEDRSPQAIIAAFQAADLPERFHQLPLLVSGDPEALALHNPPPAPPRTRLRDRIMGRATAAAPGATPQNTSLTRLTPLGQDPAFLFLFQSYTFFLQSYLARGLIEELPGMLSWAREIDEAHRRAQTPPDPSIVDLT